jgi:N,N'-diacetylchitobiose transport system permease protein
MTRKRSARTGWNIVGLLVFVVMVFPVYWMISTAFKSDNQINSYTPSWFPTQLTLRHFSTAFNTPGFWSDVLNSLIVVLATVLIALVLSFFAAVALARYRFGGRKLVIVLVIGIQMLPQTGLLIPLFVLLSRYHEVNKLSGLVLVYLTFALPFCVWTLRGFMIAIPKELEEAAMVDGASRLGAFVRILLPLIAPGLVATSVFTFITSWNEYLFANTLLGTGHTYTITLWLADLTGGQRAIDWGAVMAASTMISIPVVVFFLLVQRRIAYGLTAGAVRG